MHPYPHHYLVGARATASGLVAVTAADLPDISSAPPPQFDGPGGVWSPESLLCAAVADCFILTFRAIARASKFEWTALDCQVDATLDRVDGVTFFTHFKTTATLQAPAGVDVTKARLLLDKAEHGCLVANSLKGSRELAAEVVSS
jgi:organic hydroperoxide reductase OsmC/OhrA